MRTNITKTSMELIQSQKKTYYVINAKPYVHFILNRSDVERFFWRGALDQLNGSFSDIGAHQDLQKPNFVLPTINKRIMPGTWFEREDSRLVSTQLILYLEYMK